MGQNGVEDDGATYGGEWAAPTAAHGVCDGDAHWRRRGHSVLLNRAQESLKVINGHSTASACPRNTCEVRRVDSQLQHAGAHPGRDEAGTRGSRRHGKTTDDWFYLWLNVMDGVFIAKLKVH